jgi:holo-[acyl-carrier protein] synthase
MSAIIGIGTDITDVARIKRAYEDYGDRFLKRVFTQTEVDYCEGFGATKFVHYAARFAAKEAFSKAIGTGIRDGFSLHSVSIRNEASGKPVVELHGLMLERWGQYIVHVSLSHTADVALAVVILEAQP